MISERLVDYVGLKVIGDLRKLNRNQGREYLETIPLISEEETEELLSLCKPADVVQAEKMDYFSKRRRAMAVLWVLGGSWAQIGMIYEITRQSVMDGANRLLKGDRTRRASKCTFERLSEYNQTFWEQAEKGGINLNGPVLEMADTVFARVERDDDPDE